MWHSKRGTCWTTEEEEQRAQREKQRERERERERERRSPERNADAFVNAMLKAREAREVFEDIRDERSQGDTRKDNGKIVSERANRGSRR